MPGGGFQFSEPQELNAALVTLDTDWQDIGSVIEMIGFNGIVVIGQFTKNTTTSPVEFRWLLQYDSAGTFQPVEAKYDTDQESQSERTHNVALPAGATKDFVVELLTNNRVPYVQLQARVDNNNADIEASAHYIRGY